MRAGAPRDRFAFVTHNKTDFSLAGGDEKLPHSLANSAALLRFPEAHADWVRPGIMLYGCSPFADKIAPDIKKLL